MYCEVCYVCLWKVIINGKYLTSLTSTHFFFFLLLNIRVVSPLSYWLAGPIYLISDVSAKIGSIIIVGELDFGPSIA